MLGLFTRLTEMLTASTLLAFAASFTWGVLSVVLSPCHLAGIPLIAGHIARKSRGTGNAGIMSFFFALGILLTLLLVGAVTAMLGRILGDTGPAASVIVGVFLVLAGLNLAGFLPLPSMNFTAVPKVLTGSCGEAFLLGLVFGLALGPCSFAFMAPMLGVALETSRSKPAFSIALFGLYALGHCAILVLGGILTGWVKAYLAWNERNGSVSFLKKLCGALVVIGGLGLLKNTLFS